MHIHIHIQHTPSKMDRMKGTYDIVHNNIPITYVYIYIHIQLYEPGECTNTSHECTVRHDW